jgi:hypothetical protein
MSRKVTDRAHALLSPSAASRWLNCTAAPLLEAQLPETSSVAADEGTLAHILSELLLKRELGRVEKKAFKADLKQVQAHVLYAEEMLDYCTEDAAMTMQLYAEYLQAYPSAIIYLETEFDLSQYLPEGFGTCDRVIIAGHILHVIDLKYGKGVPVAAKDNKQLMLYALGAYLEFCYAYDITEIRMTIVQPRIENNSTASIGVADLMQWADTELKEKAAEAFTGPGTFVPGAHCQFCKARPTCRAHADHQLQLAAHDFADPPLLTPEEISDILQRAKSFEGWLTAVKDYALARALAGDHWPGFKLVEGRSTRKYSSEGDVLTALTEAGYDKYAVGRFKLFGITEMTSELGKKKFSELIDPLTIKPAGKPVLVPESDKREPLNSIAQAQKDFADDHVVPE